MVLGNWVANLQHLRLPGINNKSGDGLTELPRPPLTRQEQLPPRPRGQELGGSYGSGTLSIEGEGNRSAIHFILHVGNSAHQLPQAEDFTHLLSARLSSNYLAIRVEEDFPNPTPLLQAIPPHPIHPAS